MAEPTEQDADKLSDDVQERISGLKQQARSKAADVAATMQDEMIPAAREQAGKAADRVRDTYARGKQATVHAAQKTDEYAKQHPWQVAAIAAGVSALMAGLLSSRSKRKK